MRAEVVQRQRPKRRVFCAEERGLCPEFREERWAELWYGAHADDDKEEERNFEQKTMSAKKKKKKKKNYFIMRRCNLQICAKICFWVRELTQPCWSFDEVLFIRTDAHMIPRWWILMSWYEKRTRERFQRRKQKRCCAEVRRGKIRYDKRRKTRRPAQNARDDIMLLDVYAILMITILMQQRPWRYADPTFVGERTRLRRPSRFDTNYAMTIQMPLSPAHAAQKRVRKECWYYAHPDQEAEAHLLLLLCPTRCHARYVMRWYDMRPWRYDDDMQPKRYAKTW